MPKLKVGLTGFKEVKAKVGPELWREAFERFITTAANIGAQAMRSAAPRGKTGDAANSVGVKLTLGKFPSARIVDTAKHGRYPYVTLLEYATKYHHRGWAEDAVVSVKPQMEKALDEAAREIEAAWRA